MPYYSAFYTTSVSKPWRCNVSTKRQAGWGPSGEISMLRVGRVLCYARFTC